MAETTQIKVFMKQFRCSRYPIVDALTVGLGVNSTESIMTMDNTVIKEIKKLPEDFKDSNYTTSDRV